VTLLPVIDDREFFAVKSPGNVPVPDRSVREKYLSVKKDLLRAAKNYTKNLIVE
jgi:hypothetical protein